MTTPMFRELARRQPAEIVIVDSRASRDFDAPFPRVDATPAEIEQAFQQIRCERTAHPLTRGEWWFLRIGAFLLLLAGVAGMAVAAARTL